MTDLNPTLNFYAKNAQSYAARDEKGDDEGDFVHFRNLFAGQLDSGARVLELGSGSGRDAQALLERGLDVTLLDGSAELAEIAREKTGREVIVQDFQDLSFDSEYDGIWAAASLLHVPSEKLPDVLGRVAKSIDNGGLLVASFKESSRDWTDGFDRYFCAMTSERLRELVEAAGLTVSAINAVAGKGSDGRDTTWLWVTAHKE